MKKLFALSLAIFALTITSCKDDNISSNEDPNDYEARLEGTWDLEKVHYDTEIPALTGGDPTPISGEGNNVNGNITLTRNPNTFTYDFNFDADFSGLPIPVGQKGSGTWTTSRDNSKLIVTDDTGQEIVFVVVSNEAKKQVYTTTISQSVQGIFTLEVDLELEFTRP